MTKCFPVLHFLSVNCSIDDFSVAVDDVRLDKIKPSATFALQLTEFEKVTVICNGTRVVHVRLPEETTTWSRSQLLEQAHRHIGPVPAVDVNIAFVLMDAFSAAHFKRSMPLVQEYLREVEESEQASVFRFDGYHIVGHHSPYKPRGNISRSELRTRQTTRSASVERRSDQQRCCVFETDRSE